MESFNFVIFGFTSNLAQLKIIPALYDLEEKGVLSKDTKIIGIGRKDIDAYDFILQVLNTPNRHHQHLVKKSIVQKLQARTVYIRDDIDQNESVYESLQSVTGNTLYYLATYPDLYSGIFENLKKFGLNVGRSGWVKIMVEKPIGNNFDSAKELNTLLGKYFSQDNIFRVDHYLGKKDLIDVFNLSLNAVNVEHIELSILEDFGIGKRGIYYDATGALTDMGQNHLIQMLCAVVKENKDVAARERIIQGLVPEPDTLVLGQYEGYLQEENVKPGSLTDTFFALRTHLSKGSWKNIPILMRSGKKTEKNEVKISIVYKDKTIKSWVIKSAGIGGDLDPYEKLITEAVNGNNFYFNSATEVEYSWKFIDSYTKEVNTPQIYDQGSMPVNGVAAEFTA